MARPLLLTLLLGSGVNAVSLLKTLGSKKQLDTDKRCPIPTPVEGRTWSLCEGAQFAPPTPGMQQTGAVAANVMRCTPEMNFEALCCLDYANFDTYLTRAGPMTLDLAQIPAPAGSEKPGGLAFIEDDAAEQGLGASAPVVTVCTASNPMPSTTGSGITAATQKLECFTKEFTVAEIKKPVTPVEGNLVLNERVEYFKKQQLPLSSVPLCKESVQQCACNGKPPASAAQKYIDERAKAVGAAAAPAAPAAAGGPSPSADYIMPALVEKGFLQTEVKAETRESAEEKGFFSALQTSGSFTMMQAGGFFLLQK